MDSPPPPGTGLQRRAGKWSFADRSQAHLLLAALLLGLLIVLTSSSRAGDPPEVFVKNCAPCHSKDGKAQTPAARKLGVKDLSQSKLTDAQIIQQIREGKQEKQSETKMPAFKEKLTEAEIQSLVGVVKGFRK